MNMKPRSAPGSIGVGIIGASPGRSWAVTAHLPALKDRSDFVVRAVSTTRKESADQTAREFGIAAAYDNHQALIADPAVELVVITVKVPTHFELVSAALDAGKHVYCEWPLGNGTSEAERLLALASARRVCHFTGLQSRVSPQINHMRDLIAKGYVGDVVSISMVGPGGAWGAHIDRANAYLLDRKNGATLLSVIGGHLLDACRYVAGDIREIKSTFAILCREATISESGAKVPMNVDDQIAMTGRLDNGGVVSLHLHGGMGGAGLHWEINGSRGDLLLTAPHAHVGMADCVLQGSQGGSLNPLEIPTPIIGDQQNNLSGPSANIQRLYTAMAEDIRDGGQRAPSFATAVDLHHLLDCVIPSDMPQHAPLLHLRSNS